MQVKLALGPILGTQLPKISTALTFGACVAAATAAGASMLALEPHLPESSRLTVAPEAGGG